MQRKRACGMVCAAQHENWDEIPADSAERVENLRWSQTPKQGEKECRTDEQQSGPEHRKISSIIVPSYLSLWTAPYLHPVRHTVPPHRA